MNGKLLGGGAVGNGFLLLRVKKYQFSCLSLVFLFLLVMNKIAAPNLILSWRQSQPRKREVPRESLRFGIRNLASQLKPFLPLDFSLS